MQMVKDRINSKNNVLEEFNFFMEWKKLDQKSIIYGKWGVSPTVK